MKKSRFSIAHKDPELTELVANTDHKVLATWAIACTERVLPYFENTYPQDTRPRDALTTLEEWIRTGVFSMAVIRNALLGSHAAARTADEDSPARSAARAAGQAVATAHVPRHAYGSAIYAQQAIHRISTPSNADAAVKNERDWQFHTLVALRNNMKPSHPQTVDEYIKTFPKHVQAILRQIRKTITSSAPEAVELISYQMPGYKLNGKPLVYFGAWKTHIGFYATPSGNAAFKKELSKYKGAKGSVQFPLDEPMPLELIQRIVKFRAREILKEGKTANTTTKGKKNVCSRRHVFYKSSDCPVCPTCWSGFYKDKNRGDFPKNIPAPALRALLNAKITKISQLTKYTEKEILALHGMGQKGVKLLVAEMKKKNLSFKKV